MLSCGALLDTPDEDGLGAADIHAMHLGFGWDGAGYHAIITRDGICHAGRPEYWQGAHVKGAITIVWAYALSAAMILP